MRHGSLSRDEVIYRVGKEIVEKLDAVNCDFTNRLQTDGDTSVEFSASIDAVEDDCSVTVVAYYYQDEDDVANCESLDELNWEIEGYEIY